MTMPSRTTQRGDVAYRPGRRRRAGRPSTRRQRRSAANVPTTPPVRLSRTDSIRIIRTIRHRRQPIARRMPISRVRSKTDMIIVFNMPTAPMMMAMAEVIQDMALDEADFGGRGDRILGGLGLRCFGPRACDGRADPLDFGLVVGMIDHDGEAGHLALAAHELLQVGKRHPHAARLVGDGLFTIPVTVYIAVVEQGILSPTFFLQRIGQFARPPEGAFLVGGRQIGQCPPGMMFSACMAGESGTQPCTTMALMPSSSIDV